MKAILLDLDRTLADTDSSDQAGLSALGAELAGLRPGQDAALLAKACLAAVYDQHPRAAALALRTGDEDERNYRARLMAAVLEVETGQAPHAAEALHLTDLFHAARVAAYRLFPGVPELLLRLRRRYRLAVITNGPLYSQAPRLQATAMRERVEFCLVGGEFGAQKPDPAIFRHALSRLECRPEEALHAGDSLRADIAGALAAGLTAVWINAAGTPPPATAAQPQVRLRSILELEAWLENQPD